MHKNPMVAAFDLVVCMALMFLILALTDKPPKPPHIKTYGVMAITDAWTPGSNSDIDMYVRDPSGNIVYFAYPTVALMHLEHDDLGTAISGTQYYGSRRVVVKHNGERVVLTGTIPGEYTVNVQYFRGRGPIPVTVQLWTLQGNDKVLLTQKLVLTHESDEQTAFRFTVGLDGHIQSHNRLPARMVAQTEGNPSFTGGQ